MSNILHITGQAIKNHETLIGVGQNNLVNGNNKEYFRQDARILAHPILGAIIEDIQLAINDGLLKGQYDSNSEFSSSSTLSSELKKAVDILYKLKLDGKDSASGTLGRIFSDINKLQQTNNNSADMAGVVNSLKSFAENISKHSEEIEKQRIEVDKKIEDTVTTLNSHIKSARELAESLPLLKPNNMRGSYEKYNNAENKLYNELKEISKIIDIDHRFDDKGALVVKTKDGTSLINGSINYKVAFSHTDNLGSYLDNNFEFPALYVVNEKVQDTSPAVRMDIVTSGKTDEIKHFLRSGELKALFDIRDKHLPSTLKRLDIFTDTLTEKFNAAYADALPATGFNSVQSGHSLDYNQKIYGTGNLKVAFFDAKDGTAKENYVEIDLNSVLGTSGGTIQNLIEKINNTSSGTSSGAGTYLTANFVDENGKKITSTSKIKDGYLSIKSKDSNINFAMITEESNLAFDAASLVTTNADKNYSGINRFFGFNNIFTYSKDKSHKPGSTANSAISLQVSEKIISDNKIHTAKATLDGTEYKMVEGNQDALGKLFDIQRDKFNFPSDGAITSSENTLSEYANGIVSSVHLQHSIAEKSLDNERIKLEAINEEISSKSGVQSDIELLNIVQLEKNYTSILKVNQTARENWQQFLAQI